MSGHAWGVGPARNCFPRERGTASMERRDGPDGETLFVDGSGGERGADGPFYVAYLDPDATRRWGYVCGNCGSARTAMDSMGRIECENCRNLKKPDEWDAAHE